MAAQVLTTELGTEAASTRAVFFAGRREPNGKNVAPEAFWDFRDFQDFVHRSPWSPSPTTKYPRPRTVTSVVNRYYDPATDQFLSIDPDVAQTGQPYIFTNDDPLNTEDPLGLCWPKWACGIEKTITSAAKWVANHPLDTVIIITAIGSVIVTGGADTGILVGAVAFATEEGSAALEVQATLKAAAATASVIQTTQNCLSGNIFQCSTDIAGSAVSSELNSVPQIVQSAVTVAEQLSTQSSQKTMVKIITTTKSSKTKTTK